MKTISSSLISSPHVTACFTTRHGGISISPYHSANLAFHVGDNPDDVVKNHDILADKLGFNRHFLIHMRQIHSDKIIITDETLSFDTPLECDALITNRPNIPLMVMSADCTGILIYDPIEKVIAAVHAGRAGALNDILPKTIKMMGEAFGSLSENLQIVLGPSIHGCCYEVNETIASECEEKGYDLALRREDKKVFLDVNSILLKQLSTLRIENIEVIEHCTSCKHEEYFSYRADAQHTGRIAGVIILR
jgi:YfiH family protein